MLLSKISPDLVGDRIEEQKLYDAIDCILYSMVWLSKLYYVTLSLTLDFFHTHENYVIMYNQKYDHIV
jgi:hypothetical protein